MIHPISNFKIIKTNSEQDTTYNEEKTKSKNKKSLPRKQIESKTLFFSHRFLYRREQMTTEILPSPQQQTCNMVIPALPGSSEQCIRKRLC